MSNALEDLTDAGLGKLVDRFYARVRADDELGPVFEDAISDWPEHLTRLTDFWSSVMLTSGRYKGQPVPAHKKHAQRISPELFQRWLMLWNQTATDTMLPEAAAALQAKAARIADSLQLALFFKLERPDSGTEQSGRGSLAGLAPQFSDRNRAVNGVDRNSSR